MKAWFSRCESCERLHARVEQLCLACELEREAAMVQHPSSVRRTIRSYRRGAA
ncbi:MAG: hypothetical protein WD770_08900 [Actinomycetota bacterium]